MTKEEVRYDVTLHTTARVAKMILDAPCISHAVRTFWWAFYITCIFEARNG